MPIAPYENIFIPAGPECFVTPSLPAVPDVHEPLVIDTINVHGHPQTLEDGCEVCSNCFAGYTNRGAGTACMTCQDELLAECAHELGY